MKAIVVQEKGKAAVQEIEEFKSRPDYVRIKTHAVALNPTDWKHIDFIADKGSVVGCDVAGVVEEVGKDVKTSVKAGDKIVGFTHGSNLSNHEDGGFADRVLIKDGLFWHIPSSQSFEEAASMPVGVGTVGQALYQTLGLPAPNDPKPKTPFPVLIYGGSSATGTVAIQFAVLSGLKVVTTGSPRNHALLQSLGADKVFDYNDPECGQKIRDYTGDRLRYAFDTITNEQSFKICAEALSSSTEHGELRYSSLLPPKGFPRSDVKTSSTMLYTGIGETYTKMDRTVEGKPDHYEFLKNWLVIASKDIEQGKIKAHPIEVGKGWEGVLEGLDRMRKGEYNAKKLVYTVA